MERGLNEKLNMNMAAAKMLGYDFIVHDGLESRAVSVKVYSAHRLFNIFSNPSDCLAAVKCLGEKYGVYLVRSYPNKYWSASCAVGMFDTYEESVGRACVEVMK